MPFAIADGIAVETNRITSAAGDEAVSDQDHQMSAMSPKQTCLLSSEPPRKKEKKPQRKERSNDATNYHTTHTPSQENREREHPKHHHHRNGFGKTTGAMVEHWLNHGGTHSDSKPQQRSD